MKLSDFYAQVSLRFLQLKNEQRFGQVLFNELVLYRPELAERIRATDLDPFHMDPDDREFWDRFTQWIWVNW